MLKFAPLAAASLVTAALSLPAAADPGALVSVELVPGWSTEDGTQMAGIRIRLAEGWKTYWRSPGDSGIPPSFDWSGSDNLAAVRVHWPSPKVFETYGQRSIGYAGEVILPVELIPRDTSQPVRVQARAELGVCQDICVPVHETLADTAAADAPAIRTALKKQPDTKAMGPVTCNIEPIADGLRVTATMRLPAQGGEELTVFELPRDDIWVSEAVTSRAGTYLTASADLVPPEAAPFALDRSKLRVTVIGHNGAAERMGCTAR